MGLELSMPSLVASLAFRLLAATVISLFLIPACFIILADFMDLPKKIIQ
ncbi:MAG: hypothetical protein HQL46_08890 [Gammaproteobacteria bacterium]|nr:hypothetical protein [Gammaproteobacteria bacterium]